MTRHLSEQSVEREVGHVMYRDDQLERRVIATSGVGIFEIKVDEDTVVVEARDGAFKFDIPSEMQDAALIDFEAWVTTPSGSGDVVVSLYNNTQGVDMLSTPATIDVGTLNDDDSGTPFVIDTANDEVDYKDEIWVNVDNAGSGAMGLGVAVKFAPAENAAIVLEGRQGPPGGLTSVQGAWQDTTGYVAGDVVTHDGVAYIALQDHTSAAANDEPGVGTNWEDFWVPLVDIPLTAGITMQVNSQTTTVSDGVKANVVVPFDATIDHWWLLADQFGDVEVDVWKTDYAGYPPDAGDSITGGSPMALSAAVKNQDSTLPGWTTALAEGDILTFYVSGVDSITRLTVFLGLAK